MTLARGRAFAAAVAFGWAVAALLYCHAFRDAIAVRGFADGDDAMRLQQVRDLLAGQSWFDVGQHRMNAPWGAAMHWSRIVDLPIVGAMLLLGPLIGAAAAEAAALIAVPLLTLLAVMLAIGFAARRLLPPAHALLAALLVPATVGAIQQLAPLRIDHHGWQMALAAMLLLGLVDHHPRRGGRIAGAAAAAWLAISLEGLPLAVATGSWLALAWTTDPRGQATRLRGFTHALAATALLLTLVTKAPADWLMVACDAFSIVQLMPLLAAAAGIEIVTRAAGARPIGQRLLLLGLVAAACGALYRFGAPQCAGGAFAALDPLVRDHWLANVREGLPVWQQSAGVAAATIGFPLVGLAGAMLGWAKAEPARRARWAASLALLAAALLTAVFVQRAGAVAGMLALPGAVRLLVVLIARAQRVPIAAIRVPATVAAVLALLPPTPALVAAAVVPDRTGAGAAGCAAADSLRAARALPPSILLSGIDIGAALLIETPHGIVASPHHRNQAGIRDVILVFTGSEARAHAILRRRGVDYLAICADQPEMQLYASLAPHGLWARLRGGQVPAWLRPVRLPGSRLMLFALVR